jgi:dTDP-4-dehydrorhamnose reductase
METWLITGATGQLGGHLLVALARDAARKCVLAHSRVRGKSIEPSSRSIAVDLLDSLALTDCLRQMQVTHVLHTAALTAVADCHADPAAARRANTDAVRTIAQAAQANGSRVVFTSTDMVFAGDAAPYRESDPPAPLSEYGRTKAAAELELSAFSNTLTVRIPLLFGTPANGRRTTFAAQLSALRDRQPLKLFTDEFRTPLWLPAAAAALIALARSERTGVIHVAGSQRVSRYEMIQHAAAALEIADPNLVPISRLAIASPEPRPADLSLDASRFRELFPHLVPHTIRDALAQERRRETVR